MMPMHATSLTDDRLPLWMRRARRGFDYGVLISFLIGLAAASGFLFTASLPRTSNAEHYVFQAADYADTLREGRIWSRWSPHAFGGYGAPVPHYSPPAPVYVAGLISAFITENEVTAVRLVFAGSLCLSACATYALVLRRSSAAHGILASALYVLCPALCLSIAQTDGDLPVIVAAALMPSLLWSIDRLMASDRPHDVFFVAVVFAMLWLTHIQVAAVATALLIIYMLWTGITSKRWSRWHHAILSLLAGAMLAAPFWLPAVVEYDAVRWIPAEGTPASFSTSELLLTTAAPDPDALIPRSQYTLGLMLPVLALCSCLYALRFRQLKSLSFGAFCVFAVIVVLIFIAQDAPAWAIIPLALAGSIAASGCLYWGQILPPSTRRLLLPAVMVVLFLVSLPLIPRGLPSEQFWDTSPSAQVQYELNGYGLAVLPPDRPIPTALSESAALSSALIANYPRDQVVKLSADPAEITVQISSLTNRSHSQSFQVTSLSGGSLRVLTAGFPGWTATLNGAPIDLLPEPQTGLMRLQLPASTSGELTLSLETTPIRFASWFVAFGAVAALLYLWSRRRARNGDESYEHLDLLPPSDSRLLLVTSAGLAIILILVFTTNRQVLPSSSRLDDIYAYLSRTNAGFELLGFDISRTDYRAGEIIEVDVFFRALRFLDQNYRVRAALIDLATGDRIAPVAAHHPAGYPTQRWIPGRYVEDTLHFQVPEAMETTSLAISIEVGNCQPTCTSDARLTFFSADGAALGDRLVLPVRLNISP